MGERDKEATRSLSVRAAMPEIAVLESAPDGMDTMDWMQPILGQAIVDFTARGVHSRAFSVTQPDNAYTRLANNVRASSLAL